jgi:hypothetical protein
MSKRGGEARHFLRRKMRARGQAFSPAPKAEHGRPAARHNERGEPLRGLAHSFACVQCCARHAGAGCTIHRETARGISGFNTGHPCLALN